jgi:hypothetical protein
MKDIESIISSFVESQFPEFYREEGSLFIEFLRQYYVWMEQQGQAVGESRNLFNLRDIDKTKEDFLLYFKEKYFKNLPLSLQADKRLLTKFATDLYNVKGTDRGVQMALRGIFDEESKVFFPSADIFRLSDGEWIRPLYLELSVSERTKDFVNKEIQGFNSGAKAFLEVLVRRRINSKVIDVGYLSNVRGDFQTGEIITLSSNTVVENAPVVIGSLTELDILNGGANFTVGDVFNITSSNGKQGKARVTEVVDRSGTVNFIFDSPLEDGGWGYTVNTQPTISSKVLIVSNQFNSNDQIDGFSRFEDVKQVLANIAYSSASPNNNEFAVGTTIENYNGNGTVNASAIIVATGTTNTTAGYIVVSPQIGNVAAIDTTFSVQGNTTTAIITAYVDRSATGNVVGSNSTVLSISFNAATEVSGDNDTIFYLDHPFTNNQLVLYKTPIGNTAISGLTNNTLYFVSNTTNITFQLTSSYSGSALNLTAKGTSENGHIFETKTGYVGISNVSGVAFISTPYANLVGLTTNTTATVSNVSTGTDADFSIGTITDTETVLLNPDFLASNNTGNVPFYSVQLNGFNSNLSYYGTDVTFNPSSDVNSTDDTIAISSANTYAANTPVLYIVDTGNTAVSPLTTNTIYYIDAANDTHVSLKTTKSGSKIELVVGSNETGHHLIGPLLEISTGDQANTVVLRGLGFVKHPTASVDSVILDCLRFASVNIGSIASLTSINPGNDYNVDPFVAVVEPLTYGYHRQDYLMGISNVVGSFITGEQVEQSITDTTIVLTVTGWNTSGSANGGTPVNYEVPEYVYQEYDGDIQAYGFVREAGVASGSGTVRLANVVGTFITTSNNSTYVYSRTTASTANITVVAISSDTARARALVKSGSNTTVLKLKRINLENTFVVDPSATLVGRSSGATANVISIDPDNNSEFIGVNANIVANAETSNGVVNSLEVFDSGFGYIQDETLTLTKQGSPFEVTAVAQIIKQGQGEGFFLSTKGFLDSDKKIHDNDYYQEFSYDIETKIPFNQYFDVLKELVHVAGTKAFGSVISLSIIETPLIISSQIDLEEAPGSYVHAYTGTFTPVTYTGDFSGTYSQVFTNEFSGTFSRAYISQSYTGLYNTQYSGAFSSFYTKQYSANYTAVYTTPFVGEYIRIYSGAFATTVANVKVYSSIFSTTYSSTITLNYQPTFTTLDPPYLGIFTPTYSDISAYTPGPYTSLQSFAGSEGGEFFGGFITYVPYSGVYIGDEQSFEGTYSRSYISGTGSYTPGIYSTVQTIFFATNYNNSFSGIYQTTLYYSGNFSKIYSSSFSGQFTKNYTNDYASSYTAEYTSLFTKRYSGRYTIEFTNDFTSAFTNQFSLNYTGSYQSEFSGETYTRVFSGAYQATLYTGSFSELYSGTYTTPYSIEFTSQYSEDFSGTFTSLYNQAYTRIFSKQFTKNYSAAYSGEYTKTNSYTDNYSSISYTSDTFTKLFTTIYGTTYSSVYSGSFLGDTFTSTYGSYSSQYSANYSGDYTGLYNGYTNEFSGSFTRTSVRNFSAIYTNAYSGDFTSGFSGIYSGLFTTNYSSLGVYSTIYTSIYSGEYSGFTPITQEYSNEYTSDFTEIIYTNTYSKQFTGIYGNFTGTYSGHFTNEFSGAFTKNYILSSFTGNEYTGVYGR